MNELLPWQRTVLGDDLTRIHALVHLPGVSITIED